MFNPYGIHPVAYYISVKHLLTVNSIETAASECVYFKTNYIAT
jgi:hypothetical protein